MAKMSFMNKSIFNTRCILHNEFSKDKKDPNGWSIFYEQKHL